jgi:hypothetical protein
LIINAGLEKVILKTKKGVKVFKVKNWVKEWQKKDIIDDRYQYGVGRPIVTEGYLKRLKKVKFLKRRG